MAAIQFLWDLSSGTTITRRAIKSVDSLRDPFLNDPFDLLVQAIADEAK
jgi:hypothetical protein